MALYGSCMQLQHEAIVHARPAQAPHRMWGHAQDAADRSIGASIASWPQRISDCPRAWLKCDCYPCSLQWRPVLIKRSGCDARGSRGMIGSGETIVSILNPIVSTRMETKLYPNGLLKTYDSSCIFARVLDVKKCGKEVLLLSTWGPDMKSAVWPLALTHWQTRQRLSYFSRGRAMRTFWMVNSSCLMKSTSATWLGGGCSPPHSTVPFPRPVTYDRVPRLQPLTSRGSLLYGKLFLAAMSVRGKQFVPDQGCAFCVRVPS